MNQHGRGAGEASRQAVRPVQSLWDLVATGGRTATETAAGLLGAVEGFTGAFSPRTRRVAVYTGAGLLGLSGVVEWPIAATVAAATWLAQDHARPAGDAAPGSAKKAPNTAAGGKAATPGSRAKRGSRKAPAGSNAAGGRSSR